MTRKDASDGDVEYGWDVMTWPEGDPESRWITVSGGDLPCTVQVRIGEVRPGVYACTGLRIGASDGVAEQEVTSRMLRDIHLGNVMRSLREKILNSSGEGDWQTPGRPLLPVVRQRMLARGWTPEELDEMDARSEQPLADVMAGKARQVRVRRGRKPLDDSTLRRTAAEYAAAVAEGARSPLAVTAERLYIDKSTASRRLRRAWDKFPELRPEG